MPFKNPEDKKLWRERNRDKQRQTTRAWERRKAAEARPAKEKARQERIARRELADNIKLAKWAIKEVGRRIMVRDGLKSCCKCGSVVRLADMRYKGTRCAACCDKMKIPHPRAPKEKTCRTCNRALPIDLFGMRPDGVHCLPVCKECYRTPQQAIEKRYEEKKDRRAELKSRGVFDCTQCKRVLPLVQRVQGAAYLCKPCASKNSGKRYHALSPEDRRIKRRKCWAAMIQDPATKMRYALRKRMTSFMHRVIGGPSERSAARVVEYLGCTPQQFKDYIQMQFRSGMTWENHGRDGWEVDHVIPLCAFDHTDEAEVKKAWHYTNMRPLWKKENRSKAASIPKQHQPMLILSPVR